ncbi:MAG: DUF2844 domain-containing protein, partial [Proteobacteria bacterium]|nr:DUF2844 domain-containing protein [Pseudomonadota bacterium]
MRLFSSIIAILLLLPVAKARAVLGGSIDSFEMDAKSLRANNKRIPKISLPLYSIHEIESDSVHLKEYVSQDGIVFAITWDGNRHPDLEPL